MKEIWKEIKEFPKYLVSNLGRVKRKASGRILVPIPQPSGFLYVNIQNDKTKKKYHYIHTLVAETFLGRKPKRFIIIHKNTLKDDNRASNLTYGTRKDLHKIHFKINGKYMASPLHAKQVFEIKKRLCLGEDPKHIAKHFNVSTETIYTIRRGKNWTSVNWPKMKRNFYKAPYIRSVNISIKLTDSDVLYIREQLEKGVKGKVLAEKFNVDNAMISRIKHRKAWTHI